VGVGQDEVDIVRTADVAIVVLVPGMGDDIQVIKAGIIEIGDIFVINPDGSNLLNLTNRGEAFSLPTWAPNGKELVYGRLTRNRSTGEYWQVWRMNADGSNQRLGRPAFLLLRIRADQISS
jgi:putative protein kinase ArgK-like GTPase of G3E family